ncbi:hypothetical protein [uncultured virus]|uniref:Uncharacterized protein n=1 Tax=uncultured virus TaxID=340016 RepID=A0A218MMK8_9VIRU|nr:hypothetical protein [uncultured virus]|tara:strand:- start:332 stop:826 length:495 start_codon:yes stop_codon:yes gene_type:complete
MSKNELEKIFNNTVALSYKEKVKEIEDYFISIADGKEVVVGNGSELIYPEMWGYKHSFADGIYIREMKMKKGQLGFSAIHKHSYGFFLLSGVLASSKEEGVEEFIAPCYIVSPRGSKRIVYAVEDCVITTVHANPTNTQDIREIEKINVVFNWEEYEEYLKSKK